MLNKEQQIAKINAISDNPDLTAQQKIDAIDTFLESQSTAKELNEIKNAVKDKKVEVTNFPDTTKVEIVNDPNELAVKFFSMLRGPQGEKPSNEEITALIKPLIPAPIPGKDSKVPGPQGKPGKTPTIAELKRIIEPLIPEPIPGEPGLPGEPGKTPTKDELVQIIEPLIPEPIPGKPGKTPTQAELVKIIKPLIGKLKQSSKNEQGFTGTIGPIIQDEGTDMPQQIYLNFVGAGVTVTNDNTNHRTIVTINGTVGSESNGETLTDSGDHLNYTFANTPSAGGIRNVWIKETGQLLTVTADYTVSGSTLTATRLMVDGDGIAYTLISNYTY